MKKPTFHLAVPVKPARDSFGEDTARGWAVVGVLTDHLVKTGQSRTSALFRR